MVKLFAEHVPEEHFKSGKVNCAFVTLTAYRPELPGSVRL
jgi:hypothetical protein